MDILDVKMQENDAGAKTVREYLVTLLLTLWDEQDGFSGKRPFGNSGWTHEVYDSLAVAGAIPSTTDKWGDRDYDTNLAWQLVYDAIKRLA